MRFIGPHHLFLNSENWQSKIFEFKSLIRSNTQFQLLDNLIYWQCDRGLNACTPFLAAIGTNSFEHSEIKVMDVEAAPFWTKIIKDSPGSPLEWDFDTLKLKVVDILKEIPPQFDKSFHLVMGDEKIELHFFLQKDYIG